MNRVTVAIMGLSALGFAALALSQVRQAPLAGALGLASPAIANPLENRQTKRHPDQDSTVIGMLIVDVPEDARPSLMISKVPFAVTVQGEQTNPVRAFIEVEGSGNHCLLQFKDICLIKGDYMEIR